MSTELAYQEKFQKQFIGLFRETWKKERFNPSASRALYHIYRKQKKAARTRRLRIQRGLPSPPVIIFSITGRCNLNCKGCYALARPGIHEPELPTERIGKVFSEAQSLGTGVIMLAGGEPLVRPDVLRLAAKQKGMVFPVFTNGTMLQSDRLEIFKKNRNLIPVLSIEGNRMRTDERRGKGVHSGVESAAMRLKESGLFFGMSITLTRENFNEVLNPDMMRYFHEQGCRIVFLVEYVPQGEQDMERCLTRNQKDQLRERIEKLRSLHNTSLIALPGDEEKYGGCLAAGRGFVHISSTGNLEPCPFAPFSDTNIQNSTLEKALQSLFLRKLRSQHHLLKEAEGGCTLWENREWVRQQVQQEISPLFQHLRPSPNPRIRKFPRKKGMQFSSLLRLSP